jgi:phosphoglycolate phosphatase-like HAD superfamily hydrolase
MSENAPKPLIIFDVDGTLVGGEANDWQSFEDAYLDVTGKKLDLSLFDRLHDITAHAVIHASLVESGETDPLPLIAQIADAYAGILATKIDRNPHAFGPTTGAVELLNALDRTGYDRGIATGDWTKSISLKLDIAGIPWQGVPMATSSDRPTRASTIALAVERAGRSLEETVYVGDGTWDLRATQTLGIPFIGTGSRTPALREAGAQYIPADLHPENFFPVLAQAWQSGAPAS